MTENLSFLGPANPDIGNITCNRQDTTGRDGLGVLAHVDLGPAGALYLYEAHVARQLLAAAFEAVRILDPAGADNTLSDLLGESGLDVIRARIAAENATPGVELAQCAKCHLTAPVTTMDSVTWAVPVTGEGGVHWYCKDMTACTRRANPAGCARCGDDDSLELCLNPGGGGEMRCTNSGACGRRVQVAKAGAR